MLYLFMNANIYGDFQICNIVPLMKDDFEYRWLQNPYKPSVINQVDYQKTK